MYESLLVALLVSLINPYSLGKGMAASCECFPHPSHLRRRHVTVTATGLLPRTTVSEAVTGVCVFPNQVAANQTFPVASDGTVSAPSFVGCYHMGSGFTGCTITVSLRGTTIRTNTTPPTPPSRPVPRIRLLLHNRWLVRLGSRVRKDVLLARTRIMESTHGYPPQAHRAHH